MAFFFACVRRDSCKSGTKNCVHVFEFKVYNKLILLFILVWCHLKIRYFPFCLLELQFVFICQFVIVCHSAVCGSKSSYTYSRWIVYLWKMALNSIIVIQFMQFGYNRDPQIWIHNTLNAKRCKHITVPFCSERITLFTFPFHQSINTTTKSLNTFHFERT